MVVTNLWHTQPPTYFRHDHSKNEIPPLCAVGIVKDAEYTVHIYQGTVALTNY